ncbi:MAG: hypothetical protein KAU20_06325 [Nanoarchaeota archaeon]|nr:hypothetical protein [Nanoarchaeota archaeon]
MGIFSKLTFRKHKEPEPSPEIGKYPSEPGMPLGSDIGSAPAQPGFEMHGGPTGLEAETGFKSTSEKPFPSLEPSASIPSSPEQQPSPSQPQQDNIFTLSKNLEVVSSKVDALRAVLDTINQRLANIEKIAESEEKEKPRHDRW